MSISTKRKQDSTNRTREVRYSRNSDFKALIPLEINKKEKFVFENDVTLKLNKKLELNSNNNANSKFNNRSNFKTNMRNDNLFLGFINSFKKVNFEEGKENILNGKD